MTYEEPDPVVRPPVPDAVDDPCVVVWALPYPDRARSRSLRLHRVDSRDRFPGCWEPPGGDLDDGETLSSAARRELREETNYDGELMGAAAPVTVYATEGTLRVHPFLFRVDTGTPFRLSDEHDGYRVVDTADMTVEDEIAEILDHDAVHEYRWHDTNLYDGGGRVPVQGHRP